MGSMRSHVPDAAKGLQYLANVEEKHTIKESADAVKAAAGCRRIAACIVGAESGVTFADKLSLELGVCSNGIFPGGEELGGKYHGSSCFRCLECRSFRSWPRLSKPKTHKLRRAHQHLVYVGKEWPIKSLDSLLAAHRHHCK